MRNLFVQFGHDIKKVPIFTEIIKNILLSRLPKS